MMRKTEEGFIVNDSDEGIQIVKYTGTSEALTIPNYIEGIPVISLEAGAFSFNMYLKIVDIPSGIRRIGEKCFAFSSVCQVYMDPYNTSGLGDYAFAGCVDLEKIVLPERTLILPQGVFHGCTKLKHIELPSSLRVIEKYAFAKCKSLEYVVIPAGAEAEHNSFKDAELYDIIFEDLDKTEFDNRAKAVFLGYIDLAVE